jgi:hypothetical protein
MVRLYATYSVAGQLLNTAELFGFLKVADGRASTERTTKAYDNLLINVGVMIVKVRALLLDALLGLVPSAVVPVAPISTYVSSAGIALDPVTNT